MEKSLCGLEIVSHKIPCLACANLAVELTLASANGDTVQSLTAEQVSPKVVGAETAAYINRLRNYGAQVLNAI